MKKFLTCHESRLYHIILIMKNVKKKNLSKFVKLCDKKKYKVLKKLCEKKMKIHFE